MAFNARKNRKKSKQRGKQERKPRIPKNQAYKPLCKTQKINWGAAWSTLLFQLPICIGFGLFFFVIGYLMNLSDEWVPRYQSTGILSARGGVYYLWGGIVSGVTLIGSFVHVYKEYIINKKQF